MVFIERLCLLVAHTWRERGELLLFFLFIIAAFACVLW